MKKIKLDKDEWYPIRNYPLITSSKKVPYSLKYDGGTPKPLLDYYI